LKHTQCCNIYPKHSQDEEHWYNMFTRIVTWSQTIATSQEHCCNTDIQRLQHLIKKSQKQCHEGKGGSVAPGDDGRGRIPGRITSGVAAPGLPGSGAWHGSPPTQPPWQWGD
jgi:hypothetical protein